MARQLGTIVLATLLLLAAAAGTASAQGRGGAHHGGASVGRVAPSRSVSPVIVPPRSVFRGPAPVIVSPGVAVIRPARRIFVPQPFFGAYSPFVVGSPYYAPSVYPYYPSYVEPTYAAPTVSQDNNVDLSYQVERLTQEVDQLRQEQALATARQLQPPPATPSAPEAPGTPTVLVFRDGRRMSVQNYAIIGQTLWVLDERTSTKISLSELDLEATQKENSGQGVRFRLPVR